MTFLQSIYVVKKDSGYFVLSANNRFPRKNILSPFIYVVIQNTIIFYNIHQKYCITYIQKTQNPVRTSG